MGICISKPKYDLDQKYWEKKIHDIRGLVGTISMGLDLLDMTELTDEQEEYLETLKQTYNNLNKVFETIKKDMD